MAATDLSRTASLPDGRFAAPLVAIADDDASFGEYLTTFLENRGYRTRLHEHGEDLVASVQRGQMPDAILLDVLMPGMDGLATLRQLRAVSSDIQVIMLSGREQATTIVEALSLGAVNYVVKPDDPEGLGEIALESALKQVIERNRLVSEVTTLRRQVNDDEAQALLVWSESEAMRQVALMVDRVADSDVTVLIRGRAALARNSSRAPFTTARRAVRGRSSRSTARRFPTTCSRASCSVTRRARSPAPRRSESASSSTRTRAR